jgi:hypothetical protein
MDASLGGLASLLATIHNLYPQARVTSGYRGANNPLTLRNPASLHAQGSPEDPRAVDVAPIPGMKFGDYVNSIKQAGVPVSQAFDEATHPYPWTTGPNWHIATGAPQVAAAPKRYSKSTTLADLAGRSAFPVQNGVDPLAPDHPPAAQAFYPPEQQPMTLADLGQSKFPVVNGGDPLAPQQRRNPFSVGNILGVLGDSLMAYGGMKPEFGPALERQQEYKIQQDSEDRRTQFNNNLELQRQIALAGWKQAHPDTPEPTEFEKLLMARGYQKGSPEYNKALDSYINYRQSPDQYTNVPGYGLVRIPRSAPDVPTAPVGKLTPL